MSLLNVESYVFINVVYLVLFCIQICVDDVIKKKKKYGKIRTRKTPKTDTFHAVRNKLFLFFSPKIIK